MSHSHEMSENEFKKWQKKFKVHIALSWLFVIGKCVQYVKPQRAVLLHSKYFVNKHKITDAMAVNVITIIARKNCIIGSELFKHKYLVLQVQVFIQSSLYYYTSVVCTRE